MATRAHPPPRSRFEVAEERREMALARARMAAEAREAARRRDAFRARTVDLTGPIELARLCSKGHFMYWDPYHDRYRCRDCRTSRRDAYPHAGEFSEWPRYGRAH